MRVGALEAGGTKMVCAVVEFDGQGGWEVQDRVSIPTRMPEETIADMVEYFRDKKIEALGIACFGPIDLHKDSPTYGYITTTPKLAWANYPIVSDFEKALGIPKTIDNDLWGTDMTFGFQSAVDIATDVMDSIHTTATAHSRIFVVECMGRHCGDVAIKAACATGAEIVLVPEVKWSIDEVAARLNKQMAKGNYRATIVVAEGCWESMEPFDMYEFLTSNGEQCFQGEPISASRLATILKYKCGGAEVRSTVVGYTQRGALPVAKDSAFAFEAGHLAVKLLHDGVSNQVIGTRLGRVFHMGIQEALQEERHFRHDLYKLVNDIRE